MEEEVDFTRLYTSFLPTQDQLSSVISADAVSRAQKFKMGPITSMCKEKAALLEQNNSAVVAETVHIAIRSGSQTDAIYEKNSPDERYSSDILKYGHIYSMGSMNEERMVGFCEFNDSMGWLRCCGVGWGLPLGAFPRAP